MRTFLFLGSILLMGCQSSDQKAIALQGSDERIEAVAKPALVTFSSAFDDSAQIRLRLYADSTFQLALTSPERTLQGKLTITADHYQLFFSDTLTALNELITPVHPDASVVVYPDGSVALDKALTQFYVRGQLVTSDTLAEKP